ncbi:MAG: hypothetical protein JW947_08900 [Sedimentisphaerales bacterium]|nr:hypothetical protein [Sedimentisphaerales bacterium]
MKTITKEAVIVALLILIVLSAGATSAASQTTVKRGFSPVLLAAADEDASSSIPRVLPEEMPELINPAFSLAFFSIMLGIGIINLVAMWIVFTKAGEPGWAVLIPIYNGYVLARIGDKPGWMGILACLAGFIPIVGLIVGWVLFIIISIGVARTFGKGVLFGLGLCFLSFIFYPILAFGSSDATVEAEPKEKEYLRGSPVDASQGFYTPPALDPAVEPPPIPMPEEPKIEEGFIHFHCSCGKGFKVPMKYAGEMGKCPQCKNRIKIPER